MTIFKYKTLTLLSPVLYLLYCENLELDPAVYNSGDRLANLFSCLIAAVSMAVCIVITTFGNLLVIVSFAVGITLYLDNSNWQFVVLSSFFRLFVYVWPVSRVLKKFRRFPTEQYFMILFFYYCILNK
jgi:hypothetical protein